MKIFRFFITATIVLGLMAANSSSIMAGSPIYIKPSIESGLECRHITENEYTKVWVEIDEEAKTARACFVETDYYEDICRPRNNIRIECDYGTEIPISAVIEGGFYNWGSNSDIVKNSIIDALMGTLQPRINYTNRHVDGFVYSPSTFIPETHLIESFDVDFGYVSMETYCCKIKK